MKTKLFLTALMATLLAGCTMSMGPRVAQINANGAIKWGSGEIEPMHISTTGSTLTFQGDSNFLNRSSIVIFSRIESDKNNDCELYYAESENRSRMEICPSGEVTLFSEGKIINVGRLLRYEEVY